MCKRCSQRFPRVSPRCLPQSVLKVSQKNLQTVPREEFWMLLGHFWGTCPGGSKCTLGIVLSCFRKNCPQKYILTPGAKCPESGQTVFSAFPRSVPKCPASVLKVIQSNPQSVPKEHFPTQLVQLRVLYSVCRAGKCVTGALFRCLGLPCGPPTLCRVFLPQGCN